MCVTYKDDGLVVSEHLSSDGEVSRVDGGAGDSQDDTGEETAGEEDYRIVIGHWYVVQQTETKNSEHRIGK